MIKGGYGADNAALLVDHFEGFLNETLAAKQSFLATIWFQVRFCTFQKSRGLLFAAGLVNPSSG